MSPGCGETIILYQDDESKTPGKRRRAARMSRDDDVGDVEYLSSGLCLSSQLGLRDVTAY